MELEALQKDCAQRQQKGMHFIGASIVIWGMIAAIHLTDMQTKQKNLWTFCCAAVLFPSAWGSMREFVEALARGESNFFDGWMQNPKSAMISCNDGFRPFSFYLEVVEEAE